MIYIVGKEQLMKKLVSFVDGKEINLEGLSKRKIIDIHYREETTAAKKILETSPFSSERKELLNKGYEMAEILLSYYSGKKSFGVSWRSLQIVEEMIKTKNKKGDLLLYEAGVGTGTAIKKLINIPNIRYVGCDVVLFPEVKEMDRKHNNLVLHERDLYEDLLSMEDNSIDIFYADNVIEHMIPDEADQIFKLLHKKMKKKGILILLIPNRLLGPCDVSHYYLQPGEKATGFHFMEMSYVETIRKFVKRGFRPNYIVTKTYLIEKDKLWLKNIKRMIIESAISRIKDNQIRTELLRHDNYSAYILSK